MRFRAIDTHTPETISFAVNRRKAAIEIPTRVETPGTFRGKREQRKSDSDRLVGYIYTLFHAEISIIW